MDIEQFKLLQKAWLSHSLEERKHMKADALKEENLLSFKVIYETVENKRIDMPTFTKFINPYVEQFGINLVKAMYLRCGKLPKLSNGSKL